MFLVIPFVIRLVRSLIRRFRARTAATTTR
jgi:hypothetical protein